MTGLTDEADVVVGVAVYRGADVVAETLQSIRDQTYPHFRVVISVDGGDRESAEACQAFLDDPRFELVMHESHLGWHGNFNWLVRNADLPFFCFWQQDDLAAPNFLEWLHREMMDHEDAAIAHADVQWFGERNDLESSPSIVGSAPDRVHEHILRLRHEPLLGMMRTAFIDRTVDALADTPDESSQQEFVFLARLAAAGSFRRVADTLYHKRSAATTSHVRFQRFSEAQRRREWISMGTGLIAVASGVFRRSHHATVAEFVAERLAVHLPDRDYFYLPAPTDTEISRFVVELLTAVQLASGVLPPRRRRNALLGGKPHPAVRQGVESSVAAAGLIRGLAGALAETGEASVAFGVGEPGMHLLGHGWSTAESGGVWSHAEEATVVFPGLPDGRWSVVLSGHTLGRSTPRVGLAIDPDQPRFSMADESAGEEFSFVVEGGRRERCIALRLVFPDAVSPASLGLGDDPRDLGLFMSRLSVSRK